VRESLHLGESHKKSRVIVIDALDPLKSDPNLASQVTTQLGTATNGMAHLSLVITRIHWQLRC